MADENFRHVKTLRRVDKKNMALPFNSPLLFRLSLPKLQQLNEFEQSYLPNAYHICTRAFCRAYLSRNYALTEEEVREYYDKAFEQEYGVRTEEWLPDENPQALTQQKYLTGAQLLLPVDILVKILIAWGVPAYEQHLFIAGDIGAFLALRQMQMRVTPLLFELLSYYLARRTDPQLPLQVLQREALATRNLAVVQLLNFDGYTAFARAKLQTTAEIHAYLAQFPITPPHVLDEFANSAPCNYLSFDATKLPADVAHFPSVLPAWPAGIITKASVAAIPALQELLKNYPRNRSIARYLAILAVLSNAAVAAELLNAAVVDLDFAALLYNLATSVENRLAYWQFKTLPRSNSTAYLLPSEVMYSEEPSLAPRALLFAHELLTTGRPARVHVVYPGQSDLEIAYDKLFRDPHELVTMGVDDAMWHNRVMNEPTALVNTPEILARFAGHVTQYLYHPSSLAVHQLCETLVPLLAATITPSWYATIVKQSSIKSTRATTPVLFTAIAQCDWPTVIRQLASGKMAALQHDGLSLLTALAIYNAPAAVYTALFQHPYPFSAADEEAIHSLLQQGHFDYVHRILTYLQRQTGAGRPIVPLDAGYLQTVMQAGRKDLTILLLQLTPRYQTADTYFAQLLEKQGWADLGLPFLYYLERVLRENTERANATDSYVTALQQALTKRGIQIEELLRDNVTVPQPLAVTALASMVPSPAAQEILAHAQSQLPVLTYNVNAKLLH